MRSTPNHLTAIVASSPELVKSTDEPARTAFGLLVSSFNTVTLHPKPFVSFNIKRPSSTYDAICQSGSFVASGICSATTADVFAKDRGSAEVWQLVNENGRLKDSDAGTWWMSCTLAKEHCVHVGDHTIIVGEVLDAAPYKNESTTAGLVYVNGTYRSL